MMKTISKRQTWRSLRTIFGMGDYLRRVILAWLSAAAIQYICLAKENRSLENTEGLKKMNGAAFIFTFLAVFVFFSLIALRYRKKDGGTADICIRRKKVSGGIFQGGCSYLQLKQSKVERWCLLLIVTILSVTALGASFTFPFLIGVCLIIAVTALYAVRGWESGDHCKKQREDALARVSDKSRCSILVVLCFSFIFAGFVSVWTVCRVKTFSSPTYDFGIFSQMFYQMKTTGLPYTTLERDGWLSHFNVHVSPIYYVMLPFYCIYPKPVTLQVLQAVILASAVIPLWKMIRRHHFSSSARVLLCLLLLIYPAYAAGAGYDLHENAFLTPLILWIFYGIDCKNRKITLLFAGAALLVKEDAAVYVAVIGLWLLVSGAVYGYAWAGRHKQWHMTVGAVMLAGAVLWFLIVTLYLSKVGDGVMTYRYSNFMYDGSASLLTVIKAALLSPMKVLYECMDKEKISFIVLTLLPLGFMPLITRKYERYVLLIPYILVNLMSDYQYQHDIFFQYTYGSTAFLMYLTVVNAEDLMLKMDVKKKLLKCLPLCAMILAAGICFGVVVAPKAVHYPVLYAACRDSYEKIGEALEQIPEETSVAATTFYTVPLSGRKILYDVKYGTKMHLLAASYIVLGPSDDSAFKAYATDKDQSNGYQNLVALLKAEGYRELDKVDDLLVIYHK